MHVLQKCTKAIDAAAAANRAAFSRFFNFELESIAISYQGYEISVPDKRLIKSLRDLFVDRPLFAIDSVRVDAAR